MASRPPDEEARNRWMVIQAMRIFGFALVIVGILMTQDAINIAGEANHLVGYGLVVIGLLDGFLMPNILARKWSSRRE